MLPGPAIGLEPLQGFRTDAFDPLADLRSKLVDHEPRQQRNVFDPIPQGRHEHGKHIEAIEEIVAESFRGDGLQEIPVSRGDHAHIDLDRRLAADSVELLFLKHA